MIQPRQELTREGKKGGGRKGKREIGQPDFKGKRLTIVQNEKILVINK